MKNRRDFLKLSALGGAAIVTGSLIQSCDAQETEVAATSPEPDSNVPKPKPLVISTWEHGMEANVPAWNILKKGGAALDAVEAGVRVVESDPANSSVGIGGAPDREGNVSLDACIMDHQGMCGAVAALENIENPISVARKVMEETPHVLLVGQGALEFAVSKGFEEKNLLTEKSKIKWKKWLETSKYEPIINIENHDTIGMLAIDSEGNLSGSCTTSGLAYKLRGRVGDSPIIGAGLFVDNEIGAACATGLGEAIIRISGSAIVVELMRHGYSPTDACKEAVERIIKIHGEDAAFQIGFLALNKQGEYGGYSLFSQFNFALTHESKNELVFTDYKKEWT